jgi:hypothetical protein
VGRDGKGTGSRDESELTRIQREGSREYIERKSERVTHARSIIAPFTNRKPMAGDIGPRRRRVGRTDKKGGRNHPRPPAVSPLEYVRSAIRLHLCAEVRSTSGLEAIARFLSGGGGGGGGNVDSGGGIGRTVGDGDASTSPRLFVWVPRNAVDNNDDGGDRMDDDITGAQGTIIYDEAMASTERLDGRNLGSIAFVDASPSMTATNSAALSSGGGTGDGDDDDDDDGEGGNVAVRNVGAGAPTGSRIQCMVVSPRSYLDDADDYDDEREDDGDDVEEVGARKGGDDVDVVGEEGEGGRGPSSSSSSSSGSATFLALQLYARHCFVPAVRAIEALEEEDDDEYDDDEERKTDGAGGGGGESGIGGGRRRKATSLLEGLEDRLRDLDIALGQCRSSALMGRIPHVVLKAHPIITSAVSQLNPNSTTIDVDACGLSSYLQDDAFLNEVQSTLNHWIVQIRKVTTLPGITPFPPIADPDSTSSSSPSADLEEVSFWLGLEESLRHVRSELDKPSVLLTIALLRSAKRFVATIALENNTGLVDATSHASDVANFLRGYPAQSLASAGDWERISSALDSVFAHLPKVRQSRYYDLDRLARLVEATTLTLRERMTVTLRRQRGGNVVLGLDYGQYERLVRIPTQDVFVLFDARYAEFSEFFLDQGRMRRRAGGGMGGSSTNETPAQVLKGIRLHHVRLRERLDAVYYFRTQHEKLRSVVAEVLVGDDKGDNAVVTTTSPSGGDGGEDYSTWALKEVDEAPVSLFASVDVLDLSPRGEALFASALEGYDLKVDAIEEDLARLLRDKLSSCLVSFVPRVRVLCVCCSALVSQHPLPHAGKCFPTTNARMPRTCSGYSGVSTPYLRALVFVRP